MDPRHAPTRSRPLFGDDLLAAPNAAEPFPSGRIKRDGCPDWEWHTDRYPRHFRGREMVVAIGSPMEGLYDLAADLLPAPDARVAR